MCKKLAWVAVAVVVGLVTVNVTGLGGWVSMGAKKLANKLEKKIPPEAQIEQIKHEISQLGPDIDENLDRLAGERVSVANLRKDVKERQAKLDEQKTFLKAMTDQLDSASVQTVSYNGRSLNAERAKTQFARDLAGYKRAKEDVDARQKLLEAKEEALSVAEEQVKAMIDKNAQMEIEVARLETDLKNARLEETKSKFALDDSRLSKIKASMQQVRDKIAVQQEKLKIAGEFGTTAVPSDKAEKTAATDAIREAKELFGNKVAENK